MHRIHTIIITSETVSTKPVKSVSYFMEYNGIRICLISLSCETRAGRWTLILRCNANRTELTARMSGCETDPGREQRHLVMSTEAGLPAHHLLSSHSILLQLFPFPKTPHTHTNVIACL